MVNQRANFPQKAVEARSNHAKIVYMLFVVTESKTDLVWPSSHPLIKEVACTFVSNGDDRTIAYMSVSQVRIAPVLYFRRNSICSCFFLFDVLEAYKYV